MKTPTKLLLAICAILGSCSKDDDANPLASAAATTYIGSLGFFNDNGLNTRTDNMDFVVNVSGDNLTITFHYSDDTGNVTYQCTDLAYWGDPKGGWIGFKINEQKAGEKIQHTFTGVPQGSHVALGMFPNHHGFFKMDDQGIKTFQLNAEVHSHYGDHYSTYIRATNRP